jgi:3-hydroxyacyl-CoA dehydrogenase
MRDERGHFGGSEGEGWRSEDSRYKAPQTVESSHYEEAPDVNRIVLRYNTELSTADLSDKEVFKSFLKDAEYVRDNNPQEGQKLLGMLNDRLKEMKLEEYMAEVESHPLTNEDIDKALGKAAGRE